MNVVNTLWGDPCIISNDSHTWASSVYNVLTHPTQIYSLHEPTETIRDKSVTYLADALRDGSDFLMQ